MSRDISGTSQDLEIYSVTRPLGLLDIILCFLYYPLPHVTFSHLSLTIQMSTPTGSVAKRKRTEEDADAKAIVRSDLWFEDGNIVLEAERTQFKVHRGLLSRNSSVFRDMFTVPQPSTTEEEMVEGCAVVQLSDSAADVTYVLQALCERRCVTPISFPLYSVTNYSQMCLWKSLYHSR